MLASKKLVFALMAYSLMLIVIAAFSEEIHEFNIWVFAAVMGAQNPVLDAVLGIFTVLGSSLFWIIAAVAFWLRGKRKISIQLAIAFIIDTALSAVLKFTFMTPRPFKIFDLGFDLDSLGPSFPSGHAERAFSGAFILSSHYKKRTALLFSLASMTALSRVYLGMHFPVDVLIGSVNGLIVGYIATRISTKGIEKRLR